MNIFEPIYTLRKLLLSLPVNIFDLILFVGGAFYVYEEASLGVIPAFINLFSLIASFVISLLLYNIVSGGIANLFSWSKGLTDALSFLVLAVLFYMLISYGISRLSKKHTIERPGVYSKIGGALLGAISFFLLSAFIVSILLSFPISPLIKTQIKNSIAGRVLFTRTQSIELTTRQIFGGAISDTLNFMTVKPDPDSSVALHFKTAKGTVDTSSEDELLKLVNYERTRRGLSKLTSDQELTHAARLHAKDMLKKGYFSHYTPEGFSPFDRLATQGILYNTAAENLAFAPDVHLAHSGLMESTGHRKNILDKNFNKIGVGVIDAGIYGKMFVQEFTD